eukprot:SAG31_NODE_156_length_22055_cov_105.227728_6_plen_80_part_00
MLEPPFDVDKDFAAMDKDGAGRVTWDEFSSWWSKRSVSQPSTIREHNTHRDTPWDLQDDVEAALPILPEALVTKVYTNR